MKGRMYGYARVSTTDQHLDRQIEALTSYGVAERDIVTDKFSGKDFNRQGYITLKERMLRRGDVLVVKELDRLGKNYEQIKEEWQELQKMGVDIVIIDMPILNTAEKSDLEKSLIANIVFAFGIWVCYFLEFYLAFYAFDFSAHLGITAGLVMFVVGTLAVIVPTPNGAGPWHFAVMTMMMLYGVGKEDAGIFALLVHGIQTFLLILLGIYGLSALPFTNKLK